MAAPTPAEILDHLESLREQREDDALRSKIEIQRALTILAVVLPAALQAAASGNVTMRQAVLEVWPLLPKPKTT